MKKFLLLAALLFATPSFAQTPTKKEYRPFRYETSCALKEQEYYDDVYLTDLCVVIETREPGGALRTRNIFSNRFGLTIKSWFDKKNGFMTWDSHNKFAYKWEYKISGTGEQGAWSMVMPGFLLQNVSWD